MRSMDLSDCRQGRLRDAAGLMLADPTGNGLVSLARMATAGTSAYGTDGKHVVCKGSDACMSPGLNAIFVDVSAGRSLGTIAADFIHEGRHTAEDQGELAAWNAALDFWESAGNPHRDDYWYGVMSRARTNDPAEYTRVVQEAAAKTGNKP